MIFNTRYWKDELKRLAKALRRHAKQRRWVAASDASVEKCVMVGFYAIRKMLESFHPALKAPASVRVTAFPRNSTKLSPISWPEVGEAFDLTKPCRETLKLKVACNQVIRSHFFSLWLGPDRTLRGVFLCSDRLKAQKVYRLDLDTIVALFDGIVDSRLTAASLAHFYPDNNRVTM
jgi:hypothetical protein